MWMVIVDRIKKFFSNDEESNEYLDIEFPINESELLSVSENTLPTPSLVWLHVMGIYDYDICDGVVHVVGDVDISLQQLKKIPVQFGYVSGDFDCSDNHLYSLEGCPVEVGGNFNCTNNRLKTLGGCPAEVGGDFDCMGNVITGAVTDMKIGGEFIW